MKNKMENFPAYKEGVQALRRNIEAHQKNLWEVLELCTCEETLPKSMIGMGSKTVFDECVVCMKIHNVKTTKIDQNLHTVPRKKK